MKNNPDWQPYLKTMEKVAEHPKPHVPIALFITSHPKKLPPVVALGLALTKWYLNWQEPYHFDGANNCGCCVFYGRYYMDHGSCPACPLQAKRYECCVDGTESEIYNRILKAYTKAFNALPERDRQAA